MRGQMSPHLAPAAPAVPGVGPEATAVNPNRSDWATLTRLFPYLWRYKWRVIAALVFMVGAKVANVGVPLLLKQLVDALNPSTTQAVLIVPAALLLGYWLLCETQGAPGDVYSLQGWFGTAVDRALLGAGHLYQGEGQPFDPEGLASTAPAVAQVLLGWWVGRMVSEAAQAGRVDATLLSRLFVSGSVLLLLAYAWQLQMPLNKKIWSSSYVLHTTGLAMLALALCLRALEARAPGLPDRGVVPRALGAVVEGTARFFEVFGRNALFIFVLSGLVPRLLGLLRWPAGADAQGQVLWTTPLPWLYQQAFVPLGLLFTSDPRLGSLAYAVAHLLPYAALALWMNRRRIYLRV